MLSSVFHPQNIIFWATTTVMIEYLVLCNLLYYKPKSYYRHKAEWWKTGKNASELAVANQNKLIELFEKGKTTFF